MPAYAAFARLLVVVTAGDAMRLVPIRERPTDPATAHDGGDYDLLLPAEDHHAFIRQLATCCAAEGVSFSIESIHPAKRRITLHEPLAPADIILEIWSELEVRDPARATARAISWSALAPRLERTAAGWRLPPRIAVLYYLSHLATRRKDPTREAVRQRLAEYRGLADAALAALIDTAAHGGIAAAASAANRLLVAEGLLALASPLGGMIEGFRRHRARNRRRAIARRRILAFTGPDGVGKTTVIDALRGDLAQRSSTVRFKNLFRHHPLYRLVWWSRYPAARDAHGGRLEKNRFDELQAPVLYRLARSAWPLVRLRARFAVQCCDRFFHDLLFAPLRGGSASGLRSGWREDARRMPLPGWHLHLDAADAVILARKQELDPAGLAAYRDGLLAIHLEIGTPYYTCLSTGRPVAELRTILRRAAAPLGLRFRP